MKVALVNAKSKKPTLSQEVMGNYGMVTRVGYSPLALIVARTKDYFETLPLLSLAYAAAIFRNEGHVVSYLENQIPEKADLVILPSTIVDFKFELKMAREIKRKLNARVGFIGPFAALFPKLFLGNGADFVLRGEPESGLKNIAGGLNPEGIIKSDRVENLDTLPFPAWNFFPVSRYSYFPTLRKKPFLTVLSSRGCSFDCSYCPYRAFFGGLRMRSVDNVLDELRYLKNGFGVQSVLFRDPLFSLDRQRTARFAQGVLEEDLQIEFACETRTDCLDRELIDLLYRAGLRGLNLGVESPRSDILEKAGRAPTELSQQEEIIAYAERKGINVAAFYILGLPEETVESMQETISYAKRLNTTVAQFFVCTPFPGTPFFEAVKDDLLTDDWEEFNAFTPVFRHENLSAEQIERFREKAFTSYYFRFEYLKKLVKSLF